MITGLAFLPLTGASLLLSPLVQTRILPRLGARATLAAWHGPGHRRDVPLDPADRRRQLASELLPGMILLGAAGACIVSTSYATGTHGVEGAEAGVASATVNTAQQVRGSVGIAC